MNDVATGNKRLDADALRAGYEQLRSEALSAGGGHCRGFGFALLVRDGLGAWMLACRELVPASPQPAQSGVLLQAFPGAGLRAELTMILTAMAFGEGRKTTWVSSQSGK
jgi:hypothetical protein